MASIQPVTPTQISPQASPNHSIIKLPPTKSPIRSPRRSPRESPYTRNSQLKRPSLLSGISQKSPTTPKSDFEAKTSNQAESSKPRTRDELYEWLYGSKEAPCGFTTDASLYLRYYETSEDEDQGAKEEEDDDFDWVQYTKECRERRAAKEAQSSEQKKA